MSYRQNKKPLTLQKMQDQRLKLKFIKVQIPGFLEADSPKSIFWGSV